MSIGIKWISDYNELKKGIVAAEELAKKTGKDMSSEFAEVKKMRIASFLLLILGITGIASGFLMGKLGSKVAGIIMIASAAIPAIFEPKALIFTFLLIIGGILALIMKPKAGDQAAS